MTIKQTNKIENDIVSTVLEVSSMGDATLTAEEEIELVKNYNKYVVYNNIEFEAPMKLVDGIPVVVSEDGDGTEDVKIELINKEILLDDKFGTSLEINVNKVSASELGTVFATKEILAQAKIVLFATKIKEEVSKILTEIRTAANEFEGETEVIL